MTRVRYGMLAALTALTPVLVVMVVLALMYHATIFDFVPANGDEVFHWHQPATFIRAGFNGGYYTMDEAIPRMSFAHYYAWGLTAPVLYGVTGKLLGYTWYSGVLLNMVLLSLAVAGFIALARLSLRQMALLVVLLAVYPPVLFALPLHMLEPLHMAIGLVVAGCFYRMLTETVSRRLLVLFAVFLLLASWLRVTWGIFWLPFFGLAMPRRPLAGLVLTALLAGGMYLLFNWTSAPYDYTFGIAMSGFSKSIELGTRIYISHVYRNITRLFSGEFFELVMRLEQVGILIVGAISLRSRRRRRVLWDEKMLHVFNAGVVVALLLLVYNTGELVDFRFLAGHVLLTAALLIAFNRTRAVYVLVACSVIALPSVLNYSATSWTNREYMPGRAAQIAEWAARWQDAGIRYDPDAASAWCNTVTYSLDYTGYPERVLAFEPGIGLSSIRYEATGPFKARYVVLTDADVAGITQPELLTPVADYPDAHIFLNQASPCEENSVRSQP